MQLTQYITTKREEKEILLMTHIVLGYPSFEDNREVIKQMVENGVDCIEMQIPFSEPMADGPILLKANQDSLARGTSIEKCFSFAKEMMDTHDIPFLFMTYYNILFKYGVESFVADSEKIGIKGFIIPDLPIEMGEECYSLCKKHNIAPIMLYSPTSTDERMQTVAQHGEGFIYCVARKGVTGNKSQFGEDFHTYLRRCKKATTLPLAVGFGIQNYEDVNGLKGIADMAIIGSQTIKLVDKSGPEAVGPFIASLR